jgi:predicted transposase YbfD/YdcC
MTSPLDPAALELYEAPFRFDRGYIWDAKNNMVADDDAQDVALRVRGWGHISYMKNAEALQDEIGKHIAAALTEHWKMNNSNINDAELIADQARKIAKLEADAIELHAAISGVNKILYCIGGPLNDNKHQYNPAQIREWFDVAHCVEGFDGCDRG